ncbi:MAG: NAD(P)H-hydrate dehydratase [Devosiaceae bacterium]|nr:NAD(P)H-hydrate dehydratase [Devosiaceae bacterium]
MIENLVARLSLLTPEQMAKADNLTIKSGTASLQLMENAGQGVVDAIVAQYQKSPILVCCGPGNNGGDGFVIARLLNDLGWPVKIFMFGVADNLKGDCAKNFKQLPDQISISTDWRAIFPPSKEALIVDALFGAGLDRDIEGELSDIIASINQSACQVISVDVPSGLDGANGQVRGASIKADLTITFFCKKPGHILLPGRHLCGPVKIVDIGIKNEVLDQIDINNFENLPGIWTIPSVSSDGNKFDRGHCIIVSGDELQTGAARLSAYGALRAGAGLVTLVGSKTALMVHACHVTSIMLAEVKSDGDLADLLQDQRKNCIIIGPAAGIGEKTRKNVLATLKSGTAMVLDADAISSFADEPETLFKEISKLPERNIVITPHEGEFERLFGKSDQQEKLSRAVAAAKVSGAVIVLKGADTIIAAPDGTTAINTNAPPYLATAGSGDVLSGIIGGLLARRMDAWQAACAGVYIHGAAANLFGGEGLIASDLPDLIPQALQNIGIPSN